MMIAAIIAILASIMLIGAGWPRKGEAREDDDSRELSTPTTRGAGSYPRLSHLTSSTPANSKPPSRRHWGRIAVALLTGIVILIAAPLIAIHAMGYLFTHPGGLNVSPTVGVAEEMFVFTLVSQETAAPYVNGPATVYAIPQGLKQDWSQLVVLGDVERLDDFTYGGTLGPVNLPPGTYDIFSGLGYDTSLIWGNGKLTITR